MSPRPDALSHWLDRERTLERFPPVPLPGRVLLIAPLIGLCRQYPSVWSTMIDASSVLLSQSESPAALLMGMW